MLFLVVLFFFFKQKTAYGMRISDWSSDVCSSDLADVRPVASFLTPSNMESLVGDGFDVVLDACDSFRSKVEMIAWCRRRKQPLVTVGSAGGRIDPTLVRVRDLSKTEHDAMQALIRRQLPTHFRVPSGTTRSFTVPAVISLPKCPPPQPNTSASD